MYRSVENYKRNRYPDILCLEATRVILSKVKPGHSNYINANYVNGYQHEKAYIAAQGPLSNTIKDHWMMIMQENVGTIVMTTRYVNDV